MSKTKILIVEDEIIIAMDLRARLERMGYEAVELSDVLDISLGSVASHDPDVVLMDIRLGEGVDGISLAGEIRRDLDIPVIFVTAHSDSLTLDRAGRTDPYGYLIKPVKDRELQVTISMAMHKHHTEGQLHKLFHNIPNGVMVLRYDESAHDLIVESVNPAAMKMDRVEEDMVGRPLSAYLMRSVCYDLEGSGCFGLVETVYRVWKTGVSEPYTLTSIRDDSIFGWREYFVYRSSKDEVTFVFQDVTERKRLEETLKLRASDMMYSIEHLEALRASLDVALESDLSVAQRISYIADFMAKAVSDPDRMSVRIVWEDKEVRNSGFQGMRWLFSRPLFRGRRKIGSVEWGYSEERADLFEGPFSREEIDLFESLVQVISHLVEDSLRERELRGRIGILQDVLDSFNVPVLCLDRVGRIVHLNGSMEELLDMGREELLSLSLDRIPSDIARKLSPVSARVLESGVAERIHWERSPVEIRPTLNMGLVSGVMILFPVSGRCCNDIS